MTPLPLRSHISPPRQERPDDLHLAVLTGRTRRIKDLLRRGVHVESVNVDGHTPLFCASFGGDAEVVALLLRLGANPNRRCGSSGVTPVHGAAYRGSRSVLRMLVESGGELTLQDYGQLTPRDYALKQPSPLRRQKILTFLDLLLVRHQNPEEGSLRRVRRTSFSKSLSNLSVRQQDGASFSLPGMFRNFQAPHKPMPLKSVFTTNLHKEVSCRLLEQLYVNSSLPIISPNDLRRPEQIGYAFTCGGPTVYSHYIWMGTPVTVRRPTPSLCHDVSSSWNNEEEDALPDEKALKWLHKELSFLRKLRHPCFLDLLAVCYIPSPRDNHCINLVFQHSPLCSLYHFLHIQYRTFSLKSIISILLDIVDALIFVHTRNWLHAGISSHAIFLVEEDHARLSCFQNALEVQGKGCSMKSLDVSETSWLFPWQAPETVTENMVSLQSEIYSFTTVLWEIWAGHPPWDGINEQEIYIKMASGKTLPCLSFASPPALVTYILERGLKWKPHERSIDLTEVQNILKSIQPELEDHVPARVTLSSSLSGTYSNLKPTFKSEVHEGRQEPVLRKSVTPKQKDLTTRLRKRIHQCKADVEKSSDFEDAASVERIKTKEGLEGKVTVPIKGISDIQNTVLEYSSRSQSHHPDLLPSRITAKSLMRKSKPDILSIPVVENKVQTSPYDKSIEGLCEEQEMQRRASQALSQTEGMKRGLSLTNLFFSELTTNAVITRTSSQISLSSLFTDNGLKNSQRTVSQIKLTLKKVSSVTELRDGHDTGTSVCPNNESNKLGCEGHMLSGLQVCPTSVSSSPIPRPKIIQVTIAKKVASGNSTDEDCTPKVNRRNGPDSELEFEEEFIDDEFDSMLYHQPHMQLSIDSSESLLQPRASSQILEDVEVSALNFDSGSLSSFDGSDGKLLSSSKCENMEPKSDIWDDDSLLFDPLDYSKNEAESLRRINVIKKLSRDLSAYLPSYTNDVESGDSSV